jgi:hypothetical protein
MTGRSLPIVRGISSAAVRSIPDQWSPQWMLSKLRIAGAGQLLPR